MPVEQRFGEIWLGSIEGQSFGCGIIVGSRHILTCNHVVRECLELPRWGGTADDLVGKQVKGLTVTGQIELQVVANRPLPSVGSGSDPYDDLCLLMRSDDQTFDVSAVALLQRKADCSVGEDWFKGQGLGQDAATGEYRSVPFGGQLLDQINFLTWHHTNFAFEHLGGKPGCSGAAAISTRLPGAVTGMMQGGLKDQVGLLIPAWHIAHFLKDAGLTAMWYDTLQAPSAGRPSPFQSLRKATKLGIDERHLILCDRDAQFGVLNPALDSFLARSEASLAVAVAGDDDDLPGLFDQRFRRDGIGAYFNHQKYVLQRSVPSTMRENYPRITVTLSDRSAQATKEAIYSLISRSSATGKLGRLSPDPRAIAGALSEVDAPAVITVRGPIELMTGTALGLWRDCVSEISVLRGNAPVIVLILAIQQPGEEGAFEAQEGLVALPELPLIARAEIQAWAESVLSTDTKLKWTASKTLELTARLGSDRFSLRQLQDWVADRAA